MHDTLFDILRRRKSALCRDLIGMTALGITFFIVLHLPAMV